MIKINQDVEEDGSEGERRRRTIYRCRDEIEIERDIPFPKD